MEVDWDFRLKYVLFSLQKHKSLKMVLWYQQILRKDETFSSTVKLHTMEISHLNSQIHDLLK